MGGDSSGRTLRTLLEPRWLPGYRPSWIPSDALAGAIVAALMIPQALGYAAIAGVPVQVGLYAIPLALLAYAILGTAPNLVVGPASTVAVVSGSIVAGTAVAGSSEAITLTAGLAVIAGTGLVVAGALRLGWMAEFLSKPVITGFVFGLAVTIVAGEVPSLIGVKATGTAFPPKTWSTIQHIGDAKAWTAGVAVVSLTILFGGTRISRRLPWGLLLLVVAVVAQHVLDLEGHGVKLVGEVPAGLPQPTIPMIDSSDVGVALTGGTLLALVGLAEGLSAARLFGQRGGYEVDTDRELVAFGASNIAAGLSGGFAVAGSLSKTAAAERGGSRSQVTGLTAAALTVIALLLLTGTIGEVPKAALSAIVVHAVWGLMDADALRRYRVVRRSDFAVAVAGLAGVLVVGPFYGLLAAIVVSLLSIVYRSTRVDIDVMGRVPGEKAAWGHTRGHDERRQYPCVLVLRIDAPLFWANAVAIRDLVLRELEAKPDTRALVLDLESTNQLDTTSADMLATLVQTMRGRGVDVYFVRVFYRVRSVMAASGLLEMIGEDHMWRTISQGVRQARTDLGLRGHGHADEEQAGPPEEEQPGEHEEIVSAGGEVRATATPDVPRDAPRKHGAA